MRALGAAIAIATAAGAAQAQFFSFASNSNGENWTFEYNPQTQRLTHSDANNGSPVTLLVDDRNGPMPAVSIDTEFRADMTLSTLSSVAIGGDEFLHIYALNGSFEFLVDVGNGLETAMRVEFNDATLTARGPSDRWSSTATISGGDTASDPGRVTYSFFQPLVGLVPNAAAYGLGVGSSIGPDDFSFTLTSLNTSGALPFDPESNPGALGTPTGGPGDFPTQTWWSEGSFSGSAIIPSPASLALLGMGGLAMARRRR
ncbi:MAG: PEP-CTERM sorting domain-containing protein [Phycisphaerales bacterium]|nr:MAG: PEP-CTERM sorting domain-containing protein [Phycisphaerales bacterium]